VAKTMSESERPTSRIAMPDVGSVLVGKYRLERQLGRGGVGVVYEAEHLKLKQRVAVKLLASEMHEYPDMVERFEREARAMARLGGPHVARVIDVDQTAEGAAFMVMELLHGHDLQVEVKERGRLPVSEAVHWVRQACEGMIEVHAAGVVHRDLKPANLFLVELPSGERTLKIMDFGISKIAGEAIEVTHTTVSLGTPAYMSPEQVRSAKHIDSRSDIWSLGVILYRLLSGKLPFHGTGSTGMAIAIVNEPPVPLAEVAPDVPPALLAVVARAMSKNRDERFSTVQELSAALVPFEAAHATAPMLAAPMSQPAPAAFAAPPTSHPPKPPSVAPTPKRSPLLFAGVAIGALVVGGVVVLLASGKREGASTTAPAGDIRGATGDNDAEKKAPEKAAASASSSDGDDSAPSASASAKPQGTKSASDGKHDAVKDVAKPAASASKTEGASLYVPAHVASAPSASVHKPTAPSASGTRTTR